VNEKSRDRGGEIARARHEDARGNRGPAGNDSGERRGKDRLRRIEANQLT